MAQSFRVVGPRALVKKIENQLASRTIEVIQFREHEPSQFGVVLAVGKGDKLDSGVIMPMEVKAGDTVILKKLCGTPVTFNGEGCHLVSRDDMVAVVEL